MSDKPSSTYRPDHRHPTKPRQWIVGVYPVGQRQAPPRRCDTCGDTRAVKDVGKGRKLCAACREGDDG